MKNLIAVSGKKRHGKDLTCDIIEFLTDETVTMSPAKEDFNYYMTHLKRPAQFSNWKRVRFADKLKDCVCLILGCTREQLEDPVFKETPLGEEWWFYDLLKMNGGHVDYLENKGKYKEKHLVKLTPRLFLQLQGTEGGRLAIHPNIWVNATFATYKKDRKFKTKGVSVNGIEGHIIEVTEEYDPHWEKGWLISDCRFPNEADRVKKEGGLLIRINRPSLESTDTHASETALDDYQGFDHVITNDGTIEDLINNVNKILISKSVLS